MANKSADRPLKTGDRVTYHGSRAYFRGLELEVMEVRAAGHVDLGWCGARLIRNVRPTSVIRIGRRSARS
ncbi:hypothetical protein [Protofrankia symbiont of Coriaria ruscifolia]|uniref:Uncharacterized protein n=1 Tax=Candidatus Protofrankia californiensis TaxID=1839754 RepID=A0A1C3PCA8_9ACTN|nr:hypothetical protein [Protofrankia symbiont of Coriaria ruscifolia]SBW27298.1 hypothetical protein FDG2_5263 [Candidatus Protofrankia californiensis]